MIWSLIGVFLLTLLLLFPLLPGPWPESLPPDGRRQGNYPLALRQMRSLALGRKRTSQILPHWWTSVICKVPDWRQSTENTKVELYSEATLWKMIEDLMQYSLNKDQQHLKRRQPRSWISYPDCRDAMDQQQTQYQLIPRKNGRCSKIIQNSHVGMSRHLWPKSWSSMEDPVVLLERNLYGHPLAGLSWERQFEKILLKHGWEKVPNWECLFVHREKGLFLSVYVDDIKLAGKKQNINPMWKVLNKKSWFGRTNIIPWSCVSGMYSKTMWNKSRYCWQLQNHVWIQNFSRSNWKIYHARKICVYLRGPTIWRVMPRNVWNDIVSWQTERLNNSTKYQLDALMTIISKEKIEIRRRIVKSMLSNCSELLKLGTYWKTWYSMVSEQTCAVDHKMDQCLWQTIISFDFLHSSHKWIQTMLSCGEHCQTMRIGDCFKTPILQQMLRMQNLHEGEHCAFSEDISLFQQVGCVRNKLQFRTVQQNQKSFPWTQDWGWTGYPALDLWDLIVAVLNGNTYQSNQERWDLCAKLREVRAAPHKLQKRKQSQVVINDLDNVDCIPSRVNSSHQEALLCVFEDNEGVIKMIMKGRSPTMRHVSRTHRVALDWLFDRINLDPKNQTQIHWHQKPTRRHTDKWKFHTWWMESSFVFVQHQPFQFYQLSWSDVEKERKKIFRWRRVSQKNRSRWWIWSRDAAKGLLTCLLLLHDKARGKPNTKVNYFWARGMSSNQERRDLWMNNQPICSPTTQTSLSLMTMIWTLTPPQNQTFR